MDTHRPVGVVQTVPGAQSAVVAQLEPGTLLLPAVQLRSRVKGTAARHQRRQEGEERLI
jgi:hypothetical protein